MPLPLMVTGYQCQTTDTLGNQQTPGRTGDHTLMGNGPGQMMDGLGFLMSPGDGPRITMEDGYSLMIMDGSGYLAPLGHLHGSHGIQAPTTSDGLLFHRIITSSYK